MAHPDIFVYSHEWHVTQSGAFLDLVVQPLQRYANVTHQTWSSASQPPPSASVLVFCQVLPPVEWLVQQKAKLVWVPMWDDIAAATPRWWHQLPKTLQIVAFSQAVAERARSVGLPYILLQYFKNPDEFNPVSWENERVLLYWNRRGIISPQFLEKFCNTLAVDRLLFRSDTDPGADPAAAYDLPEHLGATIVEKLQRAPTREAYWQATQRVNIVIAPRMQEGAGMVFLEALARGGVVFANNEPTMNEYILHRQDGYLLRRPPLFHRLRTATQTRLGHRSFMPLPPFTHSLPESQNWSEIAALDLPALGQRALAKHRQGYQTWQQSIPKLADFVLG